MTGEKSSELSNVYVTFDSEWTLLTKNFLVRRPSSAIAVVHWLKASTASLFSNLVAISLGKGPRLLRVRMDLSF
jgi:hypothetical protein